MLTGMFTRWLARRGIRLVTRNNPTFDLVPRNVEPEFREAYQRWGGISTVPADAMYGLWRAVEYVVRCNIPGDFVECGVFRGGSTAMAVEAFRHYGDAPDRRFYLYDTFAGNSARRRFRRPHTRAAPGELGRTNHGRHGQQPA